MKAISILLIGVAFLLGGCAHSVHEVHTSDFSPGAPIQSGQVVRGYGEQFVVMGFIDQTNYVDQAYQQVMAACPNGDLTGLTTQFSTSLGFFSWTNKALIQGLCLPAQGKRN